MEHPQIELLLELPAVRLLRSPHAAMVLGFFYRAFKRQLRVALPEGELQAMLETYLEEVQAAGDSGFPGSAADYLNRWCEDSHGYLRKYYGEDRREPLYELTSGSEKVLVWLESLQQTGFVGTESRLQSIFSGLDEILKFATGDADERITRLTLEAGRILAEIDRIRATGDVRMFTPVEINERFTLVLSTARELLGDFRLVEDNFKGIARDIAEQHAMPGITKGLSRTSSNGHAAASAGPISSPLRNDGSIGLPHACRARTAAFDLRGDEFDRPADAGARARWRVPLVLFCRE